ncbi:helix-turn-helix domain-containing protein [bacterium]|nr:helix-turn-helix domain-containing protein [bacterium]
MPDNRRTRRFLEKLDRGGRFLGTKDAAEYIDRHRSTLDKWRTENIVLPYYRDAGKIMYLIDDLDAYLASCRVEPVAYGCPDVAHDGNWAA